LRRQIAAHARSDRGSGLWPVTERARTYAARCPGAASAALVTAGAAAVGVAGGKARRLAVDGLHHALVAEGELGAHARRREVARIALVARGAAERVAADAREAAEVEAPAVRAR